MTLLRRQYMRGGRDIFGIDRKDPNLALYLPLWYPPLKGSSYNSLDNNRYLCTNTGAVWGSQGRTFDGVVDRVTIPYNSALNPTAISVLTWVKLNESPDQYDEIIVLPTDRYELYFPTAGQLFKPSFYVTASAGVVANSSDALVQGTWALVAGCYDSTQGATIYINAVSKGTGAANGNLAATTSALNISGSGTRYIGMTVGEVLIYSRFITISEQTQVFNATRWRYQ